MIIHRDSTVTIPESWVILEACLLIPLHRHGHRRALASSLALRREELIDTAGLIIRKSAKKSPFAHVGGNGLVSRHAFANV